MKRLVTGLVVSLSLGPVNATLAFALDARSCEKDSAIFCAAVRKGEGRIVQCLQQHIEDLSPACKLRMAELAEQAKEVDRACEDDVALYCGGVRPGLGRVAGCLKENFDKLSFMCKRNWRNTRTR